MSQNDQPIAERDENGNCVECCGCAPVSVPEERQDHQTREDVANSLDPHEGKGGGVVDGNAVASCGPNWIEYEVDADHDDSYRHHERAPEQQRILSQHRTIEICFHMSPPSCVVGWSSNQFIGRTNTPPGSDFTFRTYGSGLTSRTGRKSF